MSRLHIAVVTGNFDEVKNCLDQGDDINHYAVAIARNGRIKTKNGQMTPLHLAAYYGHSRIAKLLVERSAALELKDRGNHPDGKTAFELALMHANVGVARVLKSAGAIDIDNDLPETLTPRQLALVMCSATRFIKPEIIRELYAQGLMTKELGEKALLYAARYNTLEITKLLVLECGVSVNALQTEWDPEDNLLKTPLGIAAERGHNATVDFLLAQGAEVDKLTHFKQDENDSEDDQTQIPELISRNISKIKRMARGKGCTPLLLSLIHEIYQVSNQTHTSLPNVRVICSEKRPVNTPLIAKLLAQGASLKHINNAGVICVLYFGFPQELDLLLQNGLDPNLLVDGVTLIERCMESGLHTMAVPLVEHGADVSSIDERGQGYLHRSRSLKLSKILLQKGVDLTLTDHGGNSALAGADTDIAEFLVSNGAPISDLFASDPRVYISPYLMQKLLDINRVNFTYSDGEGYTLIGRLVKERILPTMQVILKSNVEVEINQVGVFRSGQTALHLAFQECCLDFYLKKHKRGGEIHTQMIELLIANGAKPTKDKQGRTPLMYWVGNLNDGTFDAKLIRKYCAFEAKHFGISPEIYEQELMSLDKTGLYKKTSNRGFYDSYSKTPLELFWDKVTPEMAHTSTLGGTRTY